MRRARILIEAITPTVDCGRYPVKRIVGDRLQLEADLFRDGHDVIRAVVKWRRAEDERYCEAPMEHVDNDRWRGSFSLDENTRYRFAVEAWTDRFRSWLADFKKWVGGGQPIDSEIEEGVRLIESVRGTANSTDRTVIDRVTRKLRESKGDGPAALEAVLAEDLADTMDRLGHRHNRTVHPQEFEVVADRPRALFSAWYEMFPRSQGKEEGKATTLREAEWRLPDIREMGFDVVYLPPIHPIGKTNRKGRNNSLEALPKDPGSPWAIGSSDGGHDAVEPALGTLEDFDHFVGAAREHGMEVALDIAIQASPDHPWVKDHPAWFYHRPDGTIKYAENPPKKYQDIYPINFDTDDREALWMEMRRIFLHWAGHGVKIFRVDNPHTKPVAFWEWLIEEVHEIHPDAIFLAEAFTRPKMMKALAKAGFTQSYTYFTWRHGKQEFIEYLTELTRSGMEEFYRPNFFPNTPDILPPILQTGGRGAFKMRAALAATLSPSYGIYSGFELCEGAGIPGKEEYLDSEKYEIKTRDWFGPGNIRDYITKLNTARRENPALQQLTGLTFLETDNDQILCYAKATPDHSNVVLVAVNLDPFHPHHCNVFVPHDKIGVPAGHAYEVTDLITEETFTWTDRNYVRLDPKVEPAHVLVLVKVVE